MFPCYSWVEAIFFHTMKVLSILVFIGLLAPTPFTLGADRSEDRPITIKFVTMKPDQTQAWEEAIASFEQAYPSIHIEREIAPASSTAYHDLLTQKLKNRDPSMDVFLMDVIWPAEFAAAGWALPMDEQFPSSEQAKFLTGPIQAGIYQGHIYGVPSRIDSGMLYYRMDLLQKYGFAPPQTWEELVVQAKTIVEGEKDLQPGLRGYSGQFKQYEGLVCNMLELIESHNGTLISEDGHRSTLGSPKTIQAVTFIREQIIKQLATPAVLTYQEPESLAIFLQGKAVFHRNWPYAWGIVDDPRYSKIVGNVGVGPLPQFPKGRKVSALGGWLYGISAFSHHSEESWKFIQFMTSADSQKYFAVKASLAPSRIALYRDREVLESNPQYESFLPVFRTATPRPRTPAYPIISNILQRYFSRILAFPDTDILKEAQIADQQINRYLALVQLNPS